ncbi:MAG: V-type ATP synthase subunit I [Candidatus Latescibacteria bacterium]|nr:V-type ATP synthase subunit I [Candidatus Latescibacterota bacterium]
MAVAQVRKVLIACHKSEQDKFFSELQKTGVLHIIEQAETPQTAALSTSVKQTLDQITSTIEYLLTYTEKKGFLAGITSTRTEVERQDYFTLARQYDLDKTIKKVQEIRQTLSNLNNQKKSLQSDINNLSPWQNLKHNLIEIYRSNRVEIILGTFPNQDNLGETQSALLDLPVQIEVVNSEKQTQYCVLAYPRQIKEQVKENLQKFEIIDLSRFQGIPEEIVKQFGQEIKQIEHKIKDNTKQISKLTSELAPLKTLHDYYLNLASQEEVKPGLLKSNQVVFIEGWLKKQDFKKLENLADLFTTAVITPLAQTTDEEPPVALENKSIFKPFEIILELYTMPKPVELDPTPLLAPFFAVFFALCLTDAGYGIVLLVISLLLLKKMKAASKFLKLLAICGGFTILAGAITGGWFGDLVDKLGLQFLTSFRDQLLLFDPIKDPMPFFILSVALGYLHLNYGIIIEIYDSFRQKNWQGAVFDQLPWFLFLNGLILYVFTGRYLPVSLQPYLILIILCAIATIIAFTRRNQQLLLNQTLWGVIFLGGLVFIASKINLPVIPAPYPSWMLGKYLVLFGLIVLSAMSLINQIRLGKFKIASIIVFVVLIASLIGYTLSHIPVTAFLVLSLLFIMLAPDNRKLIKNIIWGVYNLYGGTSFIGVILSYIRLMALGMVTAGIGMAINTIAWMVIKIPIAGIIMALIILIFGHAYNLAINILGAFVHSLRLNYVEFFPRFFTGGGVKFTPFQEQTKYVTIK